MHFSSLLGMELSEQDNFRFQTLTTHFSVRHLFMSYDVKRHSKMNDVNKDNNNQPLQVLMGAVSPECL